MEAPPAITDDCLLVINCGSSSLKVAVFSADGEELLLKGLAERLGSPEAAIRFEWKGETTTTPLPSATHHDALRAAVAAMPGLRPRGIGHRVVHGGEELVTPMLVDREVIAAIERCSSLAPLHNPANLIGIETARTVFPDLPQVAVFDTAFHQTLPPEAFLYAIPYHYYQELRLRRYGFHGTSHRHVLQEAARLLGRNPQETSLISVHLGNGCSACAVRNGLSVDTTMGLTPGEGLVMGTRSGDVDPGLHQFLHDQSGMTLDEITEMLNSRSGLLGLSGLSNDMRTLMEASAGDHPRAALAIGVFCYRLAKSIGSLMAALDRIDALVFTGGIGENSAEVRSLTASRLGIHGIALDPALNASHGGPGGGRISPDASRTPCLVIPANEELMIARETLRLTSRPYSTP